MILVSVSWRVLSHLTELSEVTLDTSVSIGIPLAVLGQQMRWAILGLLVLPKAEFITGKLSISTATSCRLSGHES